MGRNTASKSRRTTLNVLKARERKLRNCEKRRRTEEAEAKALSITVQELRNRKFKEVRDIREQNGYVPPPEPTRRRSRWDDDCRW